MHYTKEYTGTKSEKYELGLLDAEIYLGHARFHKIMGELRKYARGITNTRRGMRFVRDSLGMLCGIQGVPARAMARAVYENLHTAG